MGSIWSKANYANGSPSKKSHSHKSTQTLGALRLHGHRSTTVPLIVCVYSNVKPPRLFDLSVTSQVTGLEEWVALQWVSHCVQGPWEKNRHRVQQKEKLSFSAGWRFSSNGKRHFNSAVQEVKECGRPVFAADSLYKQLPPDGTWRERS